MDAAIGVGTARVGIPTAWSGRKAWLGKDGQGWARMRDDNGRKIHRPLACAKQAQPCECLCLVEYRVSHGQDAVGLSSDKVFSSL